MASTTIQINDSKVRVDLDNDYICITDIAKLGKGRTTKVIENYLKNHSNMEFLMLWENDHNDSFNHPQAGVIKTEIVQNYYTISVGEWIEKTEAVGLFVKRGRYGGTWAHKDIAIHFASWLSPKFYYWLIKEFQRLKENENEHWMRTLQFFLSHAELHAMETNHFVQDMVKWSQKVRKELAEKKKKSSSK